jgi:parvulin-like peptidyl-prolyl isomerase
MKRFHFNQVKVPISQRLAGDTKNFYSCLNMRWYRLICIVVLVSAGCVDSSGNRISAQEWWQQRFGGANKSANRSAAQNDSPKTEEESSPHVENKNRPAPAKAVAAGPVMETADPSGPAGPIIHADVLIVNDETIRVADILEPLTAQLEELVKQLPPDSYYDKARQMIRLQIIEAVAQHLIWRRAQRQITDEMKPQLDKAIDKMEKERINREFGGRETMYEKYLARHGKTRADVRERLRRTAVIDSYLQDRLLQLIPTPRRSELDQYYKSHLSDFSRLERREMFLIDLPIRAFFDASRPIHPGDEAGAEQKARATAKEALEALHRGEPFEAVARKYSQGLHTDAGGAWGFITAAVDKKSAPLEGRWVAPSRRLFELQSGQTSEIIESARSFFIVRCGRIEAGNTLSFQEAQPQIVTTMRQQRFLEKRAAFLQDELDRSTIGSLDAFVSQVVHAAPAPAERKSKSKELP